MINDYGQSEAEGRRALDFVDEIAEILFGIFRAMFRARDLHDDQVEEWLGGQRTPAPPDTTTEIPLRLR
ncbi:MAG TPA: hypothetical protein VMV18_10360 [bacterium]|nr:hypothetical protein [bacterium]